MLRKIIIGMTFAFALFALGPDALGVDDLLGQAIKGFRYPNYDNQGQLKWEISGDTAKFLPQDLIQGSDLRITFYEDGKLAMRVTTPICFYDRVRQTATSKAQVCATLAEMTITGRGFDLNVKDERININNDVRVVLQKTDSKPPFGPESSNTSSPAGFETDTNSTVITSIRLAFDQKKSQAVFEGKVVVTDPALKIKSDRLTVSLFNDKKVKAFNAEGNVVIFITRDMIKAAALMATYAVPDGKITLWGKPLVTRQKDYLTAETIVLWRDSNRIICEPEAHSVIYSEDMNTRFKKN